MSMSHPIVDLEDLDAIDLELLLDGIVELRTLVVEGDYYSSSGGNRAELEDAVLSNGKWEDLVEKIKGQLHYLDNL